MTCKKKFLKARKSHKRLRDVPAEYQKTAIKQARTACDVSNKYGNGNLAWRTRKKGFRSAVECNKTPRYVGNHSARLPGLGDVGLLEEQPYQWPHNWLYGAH